MLVCNWLAPAASAPIHEVTVIGTEGTAWISGNKLQIWGGARPDSLPDGGVYAYDALGRTVSPAPAGPAAADVHAAMSDAAIATLGDAAARPAATVDALGTARAAVQAQATAWRTQSQ